MKKYFLLFVFILAGMAIQAQKITAMMPAVLQVYLQKHDGTELVMTCDNLPVGYDLLVMTGKLNISQLKTDDEYLNKLLDSNDINEITFTGKIPDGEFVFKSTLDHKFSSECEVFYGDHTGRVLFNFNVSNHNTSLANTFMITCMGTISLKNDLGILQDLGLDDKARFLFNQNVVTQK